MEYDPSQAFELLAPKISVPGELRTAEWRMLPQWLRERAFYMAGVSRAEILDEFRAEVGKIANGESGLEESRKRLEEFLDRQNYQPLPGQEGTIKDLRSMRRIQTSLRTNVQLLQGWGKKERGLTAGALFSFPGWELVRFENRAVPRRWQDRFRAAGGIISDGRMIAHKLSKIWFDLGHGEEDTLGVDYPPFAWGSGMGWKAVPLKEMRRLNLLEGFSTKLQLPKSSPNESLETKPRITERALRDALSERLKGLAEWKGDRLIFTDPNGTRPYPAAQLATVWEREMPDQFKDLPGGGQLQREAVRRWAENHAQFNDAGNENAWDDVWRAFNRVEPMVDAPPLYRGMSLPQRSGDGPFDSFRSYLEHLEKTGVYEIKPGKVADSWTASAQSAETYARAKRFEIILKAENAKTARDISPLVKSLEKTISSPNATKPIVTDGEVVFLKETQFKVLKVDIQKDEPNGGRAIVYVEEI